MADLHKFQYSVTIVAHTDDPVLASTVIQDHLIEEIPDGFVDFVRMEEVSELAQIPEYFHDSVPWGSEEPSTCRDLLNEDQR